MDSIVVKKEYADTAVGFGGGSQPLSQRSSEELEQLVKLALQANDQHLLNMFESVPTLKELEDAKASKISATLKKAEAPKQIEISKDSK